MTNMFTFKAPRAPKLRTSLLCSPTHFYVTEEYTTNGHYLFTNAWAERMAQYIDEKTLFNLLSKLRVMAVTARLSGAESDTPVNRINGLITAANTEMRFTPDKITFKPVGCLKGAHTDLIFEGGPSVRIANEYLGLLFLDSEIEIGLHSERPDSEPLVLIRDGQIVCMIMPIRK
jgi:hypothetical protein